MKRLRNQGGMTLLEVSIGLAISALLLIPLASIVTTQLRIPLKLRSELGASHQIQQAVLWLTADSAVAQSFAAGTEPDYGTFSWFEYSDVSPVPVKARYFWQDQEVRRVVDRGGEVSNPHVVIAPVLQYSDVAFQHTPSSWSYDAASKTWSYIEGKISVAVTTTHRAVAEFPDTVFTAQLVGDLRPQIDRPVPIPGRLVPPPPPANQVDFRVAGTPTLLTGTFRSGSGADLTFDDTKFYVTRGAGSPRTVVWEATSEAIAYTNITNISVEFTGRVDSAGVSQEFFIFNATDPAHTAGGYDTSPDEAGPYPSANTDRKVVFTFTGADVAYVNSLATKVIKIKLRATHTTIFDLSADQLIFKVAGTPSSTFSRDYVLEANPDIEVGSLVTGSGDFTSLEKDDTSYYTVNRVSAVVQWSTVSQPISLDTISSVQVIFIGRVNQVNTVQQIFVFNPANGGDGYAATPNSQTTYTSINTDTPASFFLSAADVGYVKSLFPKEVRIRVKATNATGNWDLQADQLVFRVKP